MLFFSLISIIFLNLVNLNQGGRCFVDRDTLSLRRIKEPSFSPAQVNLIKNIAALSVTLDERANVLIQALGIDFRHPVHPLLKKEKLSPKEFEALLQEIRLKLKNPSMAGNYTDYERLQNSLFPNGVASVFTDGKIKINKEQIHRGRIGLRNYDFLSILVQMGEVQVDGLHLLNGASSFGSPFNESWIRVDEYSKLAKKPVSIVYARNIKYSATPIAAISVNRDEETQYLPLIYTAQHNGANTQPGDLVEVLPNTSNLEDIFLKLQPVFPKDKEAATEAVVVNLKLDEKARLKIGNGDKRFIQFDEGYKNSPLQYWLLKIGEEKEVWQGVEVTKSKVIMEILLLKDKAKVKLEVIYNKSSGKIISVERLG